MTTVYPATLNHRIEEIRDAGAEYLVLEITSHALAQNRIMGVPIEIAVMTNVTHEHLDYHKTFKNYVNAKCKLFKRAKFGIINADDPSADKFISAINASKPAQNTSPKYTSYGIKNGKIRAKSVKLSSTGVNYSCDDIKPLKISTQIPGEFNVYNSLAALAVGKKLGLSNQQIVDGIAALKEVESHESPRFRTRFRRHRRFCPHSRRLRKSLCLRLSSSIWSHHFPLRRCWST